MRSPHREQQRGCEHLGLRLVTFDEEPNSTDRARRPFTCDDCNEILGRLGSRFTQAQVTEMLVKERANGRT